MTRLTEETFHELITLLKRNDEYATRRKNQIQAIVDTVDRAHHQHRTRRNGNGGRLRRRNHRQRGIM